MTGFRGRPAPRWPVLFAVLLALLGGSAPSASVLAGASAVAGAASAPWAPGALALFTASGDEAASGDHAVPGDEHTSRPTQDPPRLQGTLAHPAQIAAHAADPLPLLPAGRQEQTRLRGSVQPTPSVIAAAHLTHHSPRHGRAPPLRTGI